MSIPEVKPKKLKKRDQETGLEDGIGHKRHVDKQMPGAMDDKIYARKTIMDYRRSWNYYCDAMRDTKFLVPETGKKPCSLEEAALFMPQYIDILKNRQGRWNRKMSAYTIRAYFSAPAKIMELHAQDYDLPSRLRKDIKRSRGRRNDTDFSEENNEALINFCKCTGLRADKELARVRGTDLVDEGDGVYYVHVKNGKGGRERNARIWGPSEQVDAVVRRMREKGENLVWPQIPGHCDVHGLRAEYALRMYLDLERDTETLTKSERYDCRGDMKGIHLDRKAMQAVSLSLGHTRLSVIAEHYLWGLKNAKNRKSVLD